MTALFAGFPLAAQQGAISENRPEFDVTINGATISITRSGAGCPSACLQPMVAAAGIETIGELEVLEFLERAAASGRGLLIDARLPSGFAAATIPGAVNVPVATLESSNPYRDDLLAALGVTGDGDFATAYDLAVFSDGAASDAAPQALRNLLEAGYPPGKLRYYRGGMQNWQALGLSTQAGQ